MRLGLWGARDDAGGLAAMTHAFWRHVGPERTAVMELGDRGRGTAVYDYGPVDRWRFPDDMGDTIRVDRWLAGLDVVYCAETTYREDFAARAEAAGVRVVLHAMPELWRADMAAPDAVWLPTRWEADRLPHAEVVPVPVCRADFPDRDQTGPASCFLHPTAPAMLDRNGTNIVLAALEMVTADITVIVAGARTARPIRNRHVTVDWRPPVADHRDLYPAEAEALLLPRRYAGLSLPMQEAASLGWPVVTTNLAPQNDWARATIPPRAPRTTRMVGGSFAVWDADPRFLAVAIDRLAEDGAWADECRAASRAHAATLDWRDWTARYETRLQEIVDE